VHDAKRYSELVGIAAESVGGVADVELRRIAFDRVLNDLLTGGTEKSLDESADSRGQRPKRRRAGAGRHTSTDKSEAVARTASGPRAYIEDLVRDGFFATQKSISAVRSELSTRGHIIPVTSLSGPLQALCQKKILRRQKIEKTYSYSTW
jgi:hypothetical protein